MTPNNGYEFLGKKKGYIFQEQSLKMGTFSCQNDP